MKRLTVLLVITALLLGLCASALASPVAVFPKSLKMSKKTMTMAKSYGTPDTFKLNVTTVPALPLLTNPEITWASDNASVATVDAEGLVTAVSEGSTYIRASIQGKTKLLSVACKVTVKTVRVSKLNFDCGDMLLLDHSNAAERTYTISPVIEPRTATFQQVTWSSSDESVASIDASGKVTAHKSGEAVITGTVDSGRKTAKCAVRVRDASRMVALTISAGGDIVLGGDAKKKTDKRFEDMISLDGAPDYGYILKNLKPVFSKDDVTILNLEGPLKGGSKPKRQDREYNFYGKPEYTQVLHAGSVEVANIANNHINDYGTKAATITILKEAGLVVSDIKYNANSSIMVRGLKVGFLGFQTPYSSGTIRSMIQQAKRDGCDVVIVSFHFGEVPERTHKVRSSQTKQARLAIDAGADMILGHHTHFTSGIERYKGKYIYYGLGAVESPGQLFKYPNFITQQVIMVEPGTGYTESRTPTIYPIFTSGAPVNEPNNCQPILLPPSDSRYETVKALIRDNTPKNVAPPPLNWGTP